jgi:phosphopantetheinyl transferase
MPAPLDAGRPHFADGRTITDFSWSHDGTRLAVARSVTTNDILLFQGLRH